ncbi:MAG: WecB/TagA/CpsF family glycosyltransferase [Melioribacteraceae bacterium]
MTLVKISGIVLSLFKKEELLSLIVRVIAEKNKNAVFCTDFRLINYCSKLSNCFFDNATYYPDSTGIYIVLKTLFIKESKDFKKLVSTDLHYELLRIANQKKLSLYLLGGTDEILFSFVKKLRKEYPRINITGYQNGYDSINPNALKKINLMNPDILLVGMGVPKQEIWVSKHFNELNVSLILTVGAFFSFYSDNTNRAPKIFRYLSLEWLYRLFQEPGRLWKRYFVEYPFFVYNVIKERITK